MTDMKASPQASTAGMPEGGYSAPPDATAWVGWIVFASIMLIVIGVLHIIEGLVALFRSGYYQVTGNGLVISVDYTAWGWTQLIAGLIVGGAGIALFTGRMWARVVGVILAGVSLLINFTFIAAYPIWSSLIILIDVLVIYALTVHGREMKEIP